MLHVEATSPAFNPVNYLAQYLMRNNPRYSNFAEASPYNKSMRVVHQELKDRAYEMSGNRLAKLSADVERRRRLMEEAEARRIAQWAQVLEPITSHFSDWDESGYGLHAPTLAQSLRMFRSSLKASALANLAPELRDAIKFTLLPLIEADEAVPVTADVFVRQLGSVFEDAPKSLVTALARHLNAQFGIQELAIKTLVQLYAEFTSAPSRSRLLAALQEFYEVAKSAAGAELVRPRAYSFSGEGFASIPASFT